jgi:hypothetical protein
MPRAKKFKLITDKEALRALCGGRWSKNPRPRCSVCEQPTLKATVDTGYNAGKNRIVEIGRWCPKCKHFFKKRTIRKIVSTYREDEL